MSFSGIKYQPKISYEMKNLNFYYFFISFAIISCKNAEKTRGDKDNATPEEVNQSSQREINTADIVVPEGYSIEAVNIGLTYPVDVTFDEEENYYIAEAGGHTYGTNPPRAPKARILKVFPNGQVEVLYDKVVPMAEIKESASSEDMKEGLIPPVTGGNLLQREPLYFSPKSLFGLQSRNKGI